MKVRMKMFSKIDSDEIITVVKQASEYDFASKGYHFAAKKGDNIKVFKQVPGKQKSVVGLFHIRKGQVILGAKSFSNITKK